MSVAGRFRTVPGSKFVTPRVCRIALMLVGLSDPALADYDRGEHALLMGDYDVALEEFRESAVQGHAGAQFELGLLYERGDGVDRDRAEAARWYRKALAQGHELAGTALGRLETGDEKAETGAASATPADTSVIFDDVLNAFKRKDYAAAFRLAQPLAARGDVRAQTVLGTLYTTGNGVAEDNDAAARWLRLAADRGFARAQSGLAMLYYSGQGVQKDAVEAYKWFTLAIMQGHAGAARTREGLADNMTPEQIARAEELARSWKPKPD